MKSKTLLARHALSAGLLGRVSRLGLSPELFKKQFAGLRVRSQELRDKQMQAFNGLLKQSRLEIQIQP